MTDVDWDLLADHLGGALDGTPDQARVAELIATDPAWGRAAARLTGALTAVAADLDTLPDPGGMPAEVEARLTDALPAPAAPRERVADPVLTTRAGGGGGRRDPRGRSGPRRGGPPARPAALRRRSRWAGVAALLAGVAVVAGVAAGPLDLLGSAADEAAGGASSVSAPDADGSGQEAEDRAGTDERPLLAAPGDAPKLASGTDYRPESLSPPPGSAVPDAGPPAPAAAEAQSGLPAPLTDLWRDPAPCLRAVAATLPSAVVTVDRLDFAYFEGEPAVMIWLTTAEDGRWVHVAGRDCGGPAGADPRYQDRTG